VNFFLGFPDTNCIELGAISGDAKRVLANEDWTFADAQLPQQ
jgi:hypothetical protein